MNGNKKLSFGLTLAAFVLCLAASSAAQAALILASANLNGAQEVPSNASRAVGVAILSVDTDTELYNFDLFVTGLVESDLVGVGPNSSPIHLHSAPAGTNGGIVVDVGHTGSIAPIGSRGFRLEVVGATFGGAQGGVTSDIGTNIADLLANNLYVNIHTAGFGGGEIRGQLIPIPEPTTMTLAALGLVGLVGYGWRLRRGR